VHHLLAFNTYFIKKFVQCLAFALPIFLFSCKDYGCIEADDYGEYESQTIYVNANSSGDKCNYNPDKSLEENNPASMDSEFLLCITENNHSLEMIFFDESGSLATDNNDGNAYIKNAACTSDEMNQSTAKFQACIDACRRDCISRLSNNIEGSVPGWKSTTYRRSDVNRGVTIEPGAEINIKATGTIYLSDKENYDDLSIDATKKYLNVMNYAGTNSSLFYVPSSKTISVLFGGEFNINGTNYSSNSDNGNSLGEKSYDFAQRILIQYYPAQSTYNIDADKNDEASALLEGSIPIKINGNKWQCEAEVDEQNNIVTITMCKGYYASQYTNIKELDDDKKNQFELLVNNTYPLLTPTGQIADQGIYGGLIRIKSDDGLYPEDSLSYSELSENGPPCDSDANCENIGQYTTSGRIIKIGDLLTEKIAIPNGKNYPLKVSIASLHPSSNQCNNFKLNLLIVDANDKQIFPSTGGIHEFLVNNLAVKAWKSNLNDEFGSIILEPGHKIVFNANDKSSNDGKNCGLFTFLKLDKLLDIEVKNSGFVSFSNILPEKGGSNCKLYGRIINPQGSHFNTKNFTINNEVDDQNSTLNINLDSDFYEYSYSQDPLWQGTEVSKRLSGIDNYNQWVNEIYVRKGQILRFYPESWNSDNNFQCGVGHAMQIKPRPAILCSGKTTKYIKNPDCTEDYDPSDPTKLLGCQDYYQGCFDNADTLCIYQQCQPSINCSVAGSSPIYQKTQCSNPDTPNTVTVNGNSINCKDTSSTSHTKGCVQCNNKRYEKVRLAAKTPINVDACYDFENYKGSVEKFFQTSLNIIPSNFNRTDLLKYNFFIDKGVKAAGEFNGEYGIFNDIRDSEEAFEFNSKTYKKLASNRPITLTNQGLIEFLIINNSTTATSFKDIKADNASGKPKLFFTSNRTATNGEFLQAVLCKESKKEGNTNCDTVSVDNEDNPTLNGKIYDLVNFDSSGNSNARYQFDNFGYIFRNTDLTLKGTNDCSDESRVSTSNNSKFFCHIEDLNNKDEHAKYRLSFRIFDPEEKNCTDGSIHGIKVTDPNYKPDGSSGGGYICTSKYFNNSGSYRVEIKAKTSNTKLSEFIGSVIEPIIKLIDGDPESTDPKAKLGQVERLYKALITDPIYKTIVTLCMVLMITFYGFSYFIGISEFSNAEIVGRVLKIGFIYFFIGETGWESFDKYVVTLFKDSADQLAFLMASAFDDDEGIKTALETGNFYKKSVLFSSVDKVFNLVFADAVQNKIKALLFTGIFGWAYCLLIWYGLFVYIIAVANAVLIYLTAQVFVSIIFTLGPIFFVFILFEQTKDMFDNWLKALIGFALQQIFLLTTLAFFNMLIYEIIKNVLNYRICYQPVWVIDIYLMKITLLEYWTLGSSPPSVSSHADSSVNTMIEGFPSLFKVLFIWIVASLMNQFVRFMTELATSIGGGISATSIAGNMMLSAQGVRGTFSKGARMLDNKMERLTGHSISRSLALADKALFDSGKFAKQKRAQKRAQNSKDATAKRAIDKAANEAVTQYKRNNAADFAKLTNEQKLDKLKSIRNQAIQKRADDLGLSAKELDRLMSDKGLKFVGDNAFAAVGKATYQAATSSGTLKSSLEEKKVKISLSQKESEDAMKVTKDNIKNIDSDKLNIIRKVGQLAASKYQQENKAKLEQLKSDRGEQAVSQELNQIRAEAEYNKGQDFGLDKSAVDDLKKYGSEYNKRLQVALDAVKDDPKQMKKVEKETLADLSKERRKEMLNNIGKDDIRIKTTRTEDFTHNVKEGGKKIANLVPTALNATSGVTAVAIFGAARLFAVILKKENQSYQQELISAFNRAIGARTLLGKEADWEKNNIVSATFYAVEGIAQSLIHAPIDASRIKRSLNVGKQIGKDRLERFTNQIKETGIDVKHSFNSAKNSFEQSYSYSNRLLRYPSTIAAGVAGVARVTTTAIASPIIRLSGAAIGSVTDSIGITQNVNNNKAFKQAREDLIDEGQINRMPRGFEWARSRADKDLIINRVNSQIEKSDIENYKRDELAIKRIFNAATRASKVDETSSQNSNRFLRAARRAAVKSSPLYESIIIQNEKRFGSMFSKEDK